MRATVEISLTVLVPITDGGYHRNDPIETHIKAAKDEVGRWVLAVCKRPGVDVASRKFEPVKATMKVERVILVDAS